MSEDRRHYDKIAEILKKHRKQKLIDEGKDEKSAETAAKRASYEDARFVLPNACATKLIMTMNCRSLLNFFALRCCNRAQWEIRALATEMFRLVYKAAPDVFENAGPGCLCGSCPEGKMSCGKQAEVRKLFQTIKGHDKNSAGPSQGKRE